MGSRNLLFVRLLFEQCFDCFLLFASYVIAHGNCNKTLFADTTRIEASSRAFMFRACCIVGRRCVVLIDGELADNAPARALIGRMCCEGQIIVAKSLNLMWCHGGGVPDHVLLHHMCLPHGQTRNV